MAAIVNEKLTGSFSIQTISGSTFFIFNTPVGGIAKMKQLGGGIGTGVNLSFVQLDHSFITGQEFVNAYLGACAAGPTGSYSYGVAL